MPQAMNTMSGLGTVKTGVDSLDERCYNSNTVKDKERTMAKSAQQRFNEYLSESRETADAVREFVDTAYANYGTFGYAAGVLSSIVADLISELPAKRRAEMRERFYSMAQKQKNQMLIDNIKESA